MTAHSLERTNPMGERFVGTCVLCGAENLTSADALRPCPNPRGITPDQALLDAIAPEKYTLAECADLIDAAPIEEVSRYAKVVTHWLRTHKEGT